MDDTVLAVYLHPPILVQNLSQEGALLRVESYAAWTSIECLELEESLPAYMSVLVLAVAWLIHCARWTQDAERQLQWLFSVVSLVFEGFARYSLILSESQMDLSGASCISKLWLGER